MAHRFTVKPPKQLNSAGELRLRRAILYFGFVVAVISVLQFFTSPDKVFWLFEGEYAEPSLGPFVSRDRYAAFIELLLPLALYEAFASQRVVVSYTAIGATMLALVIAGASRAGSVLVLVESAAVPLLMSRCRRFRSRNAGRVATSFLLLGIVFSAVVGWTHLWERIQGARSLPLPSRNAGVIDVHGTGQAGDRIWPRQFRTVYPASALFDTGLLVNHAHNDWAEWAVEGGLPMVALLLLVPVAVARRAFQIPWILGVLCSE